MQYDKSKSNIGSDGWPIEATFSSPEEFNNYSDAKSSGIDFAQYLKNPKARPVASTSYTPLPGVEYESTPLTSAADVFGSFALDYVTTALAKDPEWLKQWNDTYVDAKDSLSQLIKDAKLYPAETVAAARQQLTELESRYKRGSDTAYAAWGKKPSDKDTPNIAQLSIYAAAQTPPDTEKILQSNLDALSGSLQTAVDLELKYGSQLTNLAGNAEREQMLKNIQAATDTPEIAALRRKKAESLTAAEAKQLKEYTDKFAKTPTAELAANVDTLFNQNIQRGKLAQYKELMPQYKNQYFAQMPGAEKTLASLGRLGSEMAAQANTTPELTAFETQVAGPVYGTDIGKIAGPTSGQALAQIAGPTYGQELGSVARPEAGKLLNAVEGPMYGQELGQVEGPTSGQLIGQVKGPMYGQELGQVAGPTSGQFLGQVQGPIYGQELNQVQGPVYGQYLSQVQGPTADLSLGGMEAYRAGDYTSNIAGPQLQSGLGNIDQNIVSQYMGAMPGVAQGAQELGRQINLDLAAGRSLTPEQERLATQTARQAYADRGMALGPQAITAEILNRDEFANQRYRERQAAAQQAMGTISSLYQPALSQAYARQVGAEQYGLGAQAQAFGQGMSQEELQKAAQAQEYQQRFGLEQLGLNLQSQQYQQALGQEQLGLSGQAQKFAQATTREQQQAAIQAQQYQQALGQEQLGLTTQAQQFGQAATKEQQQAAIQSQQYQQVLGKEQLGLTTQAQQFGQAATREQQQAAIQSQKYQQALGKEQLGLSTQAQQFGQASTREQQQAAIQGQQYQQALGKEQLGLSTQAQQFEQAATKEQQKATIQGQQFAQALSRSEAEVNRIQAANTLKANAAQIASGVLGAQQQALSPAMSAYFNVPPTQGAYATSVNQAANQFEQAGLNIANPTNPVLTGLSMMPYENSLAQYSNQANYAASYMQGIASRPSGGGKSRGLCCFIMLEARYGNGVMDEVVRRYRDENVTPHNCRGYYKLAEVFVPLMRKSKLFKFAVAKLFADPFVSYMKWHYGQNKHGWLFKPFQAFWMKMFDLLGQDTPFIRESGEVV